MPFALPAKMPSFKITANSVSVLGGMQLDLPKKEKINMKQKSLNESDRKASWGGTASKRGL